MKVFNYIILIVGMIAIFEVAGIPTGVSNILSFVGINIGVSSTTIGSGFYLAILAIMSAAIVVGVGVGFITKSPSENYVILPLIVGSLFFFGAAFTSVINWTFENTPIWSSTIVSIILGLLSVGYMVSLVEFFRGTD